MIVIGLALRLYGYNFDDGQLIHPDESAIDQVVASLGCCLGGPNSGQAATWPSPLSHFFDARLAPYDPHLFNYGSLPLYLLAIVSRGIAKVGYIVPTLSGWRTAADLVHVNWIGRWLSALFDTASLVLVYRLARRIFDDAVALLALVFATFSVLAIQLSHFYAVDTLLTFLVLATLLSAVVVAQEGRRRSSLLTGLAFGAALATKSSALPLVVPIAAASGIRIWRTIRLKGPSVEHIAQVPALCRSTRAEGHPTLQMFRTKAREINAILLWLVVTLLTAVVAFAVFEPYGILDHAQLVADVQTQNGIIVSHSIPAPYTIQFVGSTPYLYYLKNLLLWYLGPALGLSACAGTAWIGMRGFRGKLECGQLVCLLWVITYVAIVGRFWAKFGRYLLPVTPVLCIFAAAFLILGIRKAHGWLRLSMRGATVVVVICTVGWALAYVHIYTVTNSQVTASRWIYHHIRPGVPFATEGAWDRSLPLCLPQPGECPSGYTSYQLNLYSPDNAQKVRRLAYALSHDQYIVMSTQRFVDSIPREPGIYPVTVRYYRLLFHDRLNFRLTARFKVYPQLGPWVIDDSSADENFSVFDHPDVRIFRRVAGISERRAIRLLTQTHVSNLSVPEADSRPPTWSRIPSWPVAQGKMRASHRISATEPPVDIGAVHQDHRLMLNQQQWSQDQAAPTYDNMFPPHGFGMNHPIALWLALIELLGLAGFPVTFFAFRGLLDRGWVVGKTVGLFAAGWLIWVLVSTGLLRYTAESIWIVLGVVFCVGAALWWLQRKAIGRHIRVRGREMLIAEAIFLAGFFVFVGLRMLYPDLGHQFSPVSPGNIGSGRMGEKQLDLAFLNAISRSQTFPPLDPFFSGGYINYYYFGYVLVATLCKATFVAPTTGFNLAIPMFFGLMAGTAYSIGRRLTRSIGFGLLATLFVCCIGNLNGVVQLQGDLQSVSPIRFSAPLLGGVVQATAGLFQVILHQTPMPAFDFWASTRLVPPVGTDFAEFPYFTYLFGDLHAHLMAYPLDLAVLGLSLSLAVTTAPARGFRLVGLITVAGFFLGAIEATNPLDFPTYLVVLTVGMYLALRHGRGKVMSGSQARADRPSGPTDGPVPPSRTAVFGRVREARGSERSPPHPRPGPRYGSPILRAFAVCSAAALCGVAMFPPLVQGYHPVFNTGISTVESQTASVRSVLASQSGVLPGPLEAAVHNTIVTPLSTFWEIFGLFCFLTLSWIALLPFSRSSRSGAARTLATKSVSKRRLYILFALVALAGPMTFAVLDLWLWAFLSLGATAALFAAVVRWRTLPPTQLWTLGMLLSALALAGFCETFFIPDYLSGSLAFRMNTVAKLYNQIWVLLAIAAAGSFAFVWQNHFQRRRSSSSDRGSILPNGRHPRIPTRVLVWSRRCWLATFTFLLFGCLIYTFAGTVARETYRQTWLPENSVPLTLDGMAFMRVAYPGDYAAITWLNAHVRGTPTLIEADQADYNWRSRVVQFTGLPTLYGGIYEPAQRYPSEVAPRQSVLEEIFSTVGSGVSQSQMAQFHVAGCPTGRMAAGCFATALLRDFHVSYVYVGLMEQQLWPRGVLKFAHMPALQRVFRYGRVSIYHVTGSPT